VKEGIGYITTSSSGCVSKKLFIEVEGYVMFCRVFFTTLELSLFIGFPLKEAHEHFFSK
jgi:hypothetical protein